ncbi:3-hydroxy-3-methylglutaryl coenzyme A synthase [Microsporum canis]
MLIGPNAPLVFESTRGSFLQHTYDFYKGDFKSEYPIVDGQFSNKCYLKALDKCYKHYQAKKAAGSKAVRNGTVGGTPLDSFDYFAFHAPNYPLNPLFEGIPAEIKEIGYEDSLGDKRVERVQPGLTAPIMCGNSYTASVYFGLTGLLSNVKNTELLGRRIGFFSYGSGLASSMFSLRVGGGTGGMVKKLDLIQRLEGRQAKSPEFYDEMCRLREKAYQQQNYTPQGSVETLAGT